MKLKFNDLNVGDKYYRHRDDYDNSLLEGAAFAYFELIHVLKKNDENSFNMNRVHIYFYADGEISRSPDFIKMNKENWDDSWSNVEFFHHEKIMYREAMKIFWETV